MALLKKRSMNVVMRKGKLSRCSNSNTTEIALEDILRLSGRVIMAASREILAPSSSLSPINDPIRSYNQITLSTAGRFLDHALEMH